MLHSSYCTRNYVGDISGCAQYTQSNYQHYRIFHGIVKIYNLAFGARGSGYLCSTGYIGFTKLSRKQFDIICQGGDEVKSFGDEHWVDGRKDNFNISFK